MLGFFKGEMDILDTRVAAAKTKNEIVQREEVLRSVVMRDTPRICKICKIGEV